MQAVHTLKNRVQSGCLCVNETIKTILASEKWYTVATATTSVAMGTFLFASPFTTLVIASSALASMPLITFTAEKFGQNGANFNRAWMITALLISSSALAVLGTSGLVVASWGVTALKSYAFSDVLFFGALGTGITGCLGGLAQELYKTGVKLYKEPKWEAMENYLASDASKNPMTKLERLFFPLTVINPQFVIRNSNLFGGSLLNRAFACMSKEETESSFNSLLQSFKSLSLYMNDEDKRNTFNALCTYYRRMSEDKQTEHLSELARVAKDAQLYLPQAIKNNYDAKASALRSSLEQVSQAFFNRYETLKTNVETLENQDPINEILLGEVSKEIQTLRSEIVKYSNELVTYLETEKNSVPSWNRFLNIPKKVPFIKTTDSFKRLSQITLDLTDGNGQILQTVTKLNSQLQAKNQEAIDREDPTWNFFLTDSSGNDATQNWIEILNQEFGVATPNDLDAAMDRLGISTLGEVIDNVLQGDMNKLNDKQELWDLIKAYKAEQLNKPVAQNAGLKVKIYSFLANTAVNSTSKSVRIASKVSYRAIMIFSTVAPIIAFPELAAFGAATGVIYYGIKPIRNFLSLGPSLQSGSTRYLSSTLKLAARRPLLNLITSPLAPEFTSFNSANVFGKLRIISVEFILGLLVLNATLPNDYSDATYGLGGIIQGFSLGREIVELGQRTYRRFVPVASSLPAAGVTLRRIVRR